MVERYLEKYKCIDGNFLCSSWLGNRFNIKQIFHELKAKSIFILKLMMFICIILSFVNFVAFPSYIFFSPFLVLSFIAGNSLISYFLQRQNSHTIYFLDLTGATLGGVVFCYFDTLVKRRELFYSYTNFTGSVHAV